MKKILHVGQLIGGLDVYIRNTIIHSDGRFEYVIVHGEDDSSKPIIKEGVKIVEYKVSLQRDLNAVKDLRCLKQVVDIIRKEKPDLIHCHSAKGGAIGRIAGWITGTVTCYTPHAFSFLCTPSKFKSGIYKLIERFTRFGTYVMACSESEQQMAMTEVGYDKNHTLVWHNAVPDVSEEHGNIPEIEGDYACYIGRPCYQKNVLFLVDVIEKLKEMGEKLKFILLGVGYHSPDLQALQNKIREKGLDGYIVLEPWINHADCQEYVKRSLFYITTSLYEGLPLAVIEAMAQSKVVIASDVIGNRDCVEDGVTGFLLPHDVDKFAELICRIVDDKNLRKGMEQRARKIFLSKFYIDKQIGSLMGKYDSLIV